MNPLHRSANGKRNARQLYIIPVCFLMLTFAACKQKSQKHESPKDYCITDSLYKTLGIATATDSLVNDQLQLNGKVTFNDNNVIHVYPLVSGTVQKVDVQLGDHVHKGQVMAVIKSSELVGFSNDLLNAKTNLAVAKKNLDATQDLYKSGLASQRDLLSAQVGLEQAQSTVQRVERMLSINEGNGTSDIQIVKAPIDGFIVEKFINSDTKLRADNGNPMFTISDLNNVWVIANAYESDIDKIKMGDHAQITTLTYTDKKFIGTVDKIFNVLDPVNKVMRVRVQLPNPGYLLKPEMYTSVMLSSAINKSELPAVPSKAIIFDNSKHYVLVIKDKCNIAIREVRPGIVEGDHTFIQQGIHSGEQVIASNQLYIYQALNMNNR
ncbi:efflux RND transporter periplasmic adaptor subunit [Chitinophaga flava]|uniref:Efflux RND transporter periplasmic adaptor subunit n=1 Tax=Chitinophaga flava TaxID=2259036 RepID=A0A365XT74_9BACT|nr:efflux RND transporter periplasmic adaptor subunit [Chitinophaga flava]RBL89559.1 efflux RND transporter periplasmic adaptor subunit [Chitinophaga flava]